MPATLDPTLFRGPLLVTAGYFTLWYALLLGLQSRTKYKLIAEYAARGERFDRYFGNDPRMLAADRAVINTHEQMVPFLTSMWLHAVLVSPGSAAGLGALYTFLRALYPVLLGREVSHTQSRRVVLVTAPCYLIVGYLGLTCVFRAFV